MQIDFARYIVIQIDHL